jgi:hypothetical protein
MVSVKATKGAPAPPAPVFPPRRDFSSLSVVDLLQAREAYHVYLASLENVVATAIGRYLIREDDWYATHPPDEPRPAGKPKKHVPRTLENSIVRPWSWPAVLVFVNEWPATPPNVVPRSLYLPDGRVVPTCVVAAKPDESAEPPAPGPSTVSGLLGGGYACVREHQGVSLYGTFGCLVYKDGTYYALTNRHVSGTELDPIKAWARGEYHVVGRTAPYGIQTISMSKAFPEWPDDSTQLRLDAGLVRVDRFDDWTSQVFGIGEIGPAFDATEQSITLDLIGCPVRAFAGTSGVVEGEIRALFFRYEAQSGVQHATDVLIGPRTGKARKTTNAPFTQPGDSGTIWFYDPPGKPTEPTDIPTVDAPARGLRARRLRPVAMQWGGERFETKDGQSAFALGAFVSTICREVGFEIVRDWSTGHDEYWGKLGHFAVGWKACGLLSGNLATLMQKNQARIGFDDAHLSQGSAFHMGRGGFVPLADVPDYVWVNSRPNEPIQHFADIDIVDIEGNPSLLDQGLDDPDSVSAAHWKETFDGFAEKGVGPDEGALPFRVWQLWEAMRDYAKKKDVIRYVAAAGVLAHYVGDASQPLHCSYLHHGVPPMVKVGSRKYPIRKMLGPKKENPDYTAFKATPEAKIHGLYEETMLEIDTATALAGVNAALKKKSSWPRDIKSGHDAAVETIRLMGEVRAKLAPMDIIGADDPSEKPQARAKALWAKTKIRNATMDALAGSVRLLAKLWTSAWNQGGGKNLASGKIVAFSEDDLESIYRHEKGFAPSLSLAKLASSGKFEP